MSSPDEPFPSDVIHDREFREVVDHLFTLTGMYISPRTLNTVLAFIQGYVHARDGGPLIGFHQWLVVRQDGGNCLHWTGHVHSVAETSDDDELQLEIAWKLFREFFEYRERNGLTTIYQAYASWLCSQSWYNGPLSDATSTKNENH